MGRMLGVCICRPNSGLSTYMDWERVLSPIVPHHSSSLSYLAVWITAQKQKQYKNKKPVDFLKRFKQSHHVSSPARVEFLEEGKAMFTHYCAWQSGCGPHTDSRQQAVFRKWENLPVNN